MTDQIITRLEKLNNDKLIDIIKNYRQYGYDDKLRESAISILEKRGITKEALQLTGNFKNHTYDFAEELFKSFKKNSKIAFLFYGIILFTNIIFPLLSRNSEVLGTMVLVINICAVLSYFIFLLKSFSNQNQFYKVIGKEYGTEGLLIYLLAGMPLYFIMYFYFQSQMNEKMKEIT